jgi:pSer/pThr/pTyr-binding forkhead associated (FHA) protein
VSPVPRAILSVRWGPLASRKVLIEPGAAVRVGRGERCDLAVPHDARMDAAHFELGWDGALSTIRDLGSAGGTMLQGAPVTRGHVPHGAWIRAGDTVFMVHVEGRTARAPSMDPPELAQAKERARGALSAEPLPLFALLDAARDDRILEILRESPEEHRSLYEGAQGDGLAEVAPYLVALPRGSALPARLVDEGWGRSWGVYLASRRPLKEVRTHLRRLLMVRLDDGEGRFYFRFYDPRVLRDFLPACSVRQDEEMFGDRDVERYLLEGERGEPLRFTPGGRVERC